MELISPLACMGWDYSLGLEPWWDRRSQRGVKSPNNGSRGYRFHSGIFPSTAKAGRLDLKETAPKRQIGPGMSCFCTLQAQAGERSPQQWLRETLGQLCITHTHTQSHKYT